MTSLIGDKHKAEKLPQDGRDEEDASSSDGDVGNERGNWGRHLEFVLVALGYAVGLGNIWRFPYLCMRNGGGAFLVPYFFFMLTCIIPLYGLEYSIAQYSNKGATLVWQLSPMFRGIGWAMMAISTICNLYYNIIIAWIIYYLYSSFTTNLPWASCDNPWNTEACYSRVTDNGNQTNSSQGNYTDTEVVNATMLNNTAASRMTSAEEFWLFNVLQLSSGVDNFGGIRLELLACMAVAWLIVLLCMIKGIHSLGKVVYVTATAPYVFFLIFLVRGLLLPGSTDGVLYYITPEWERLLSVKVWVEASLQIFYSLGPAWGGLITMASYNKFHNNCLRDAILIPTMICMTSFLAGFVVFSIIGFMAHEANVPVDEVITSGPGLIFAAYPEALSRLPVASFWAICFFLMLVTVGLDTQFTSMETVVTGLSDRFPILNRFGKSTLVIVVCILGFLISIPFVSRAGVYYFQIVDWYVAVFTVPVIAFLECFVIGFVYGAGRFYRDIEAMIGYRPSILWKFFLFIIAPIITLLIVFFNLYTATKPSYGDYQYPVSAVVAGWIIAFISSVPIFAMAIVTVFSKSGSLLQKIRTAARPATDWGPAASSGMKKDHEYHTLQVMCPPKEKADFMTD